MSYLNKDYYELRKALTNSATNGANVLQPAVMSEAITNYVQQIPTVRNFIPRIPWTTPTYIWVNRTSVGASGSVSGGDGSVLTFSDDTFTKGSNALSQIYRLFQISNMERMGTEPLVDLVASSLVEALKGLARTEDSYIISGDPNNSSGFPGLLSQTTGTVPTTSVGASGITISRYILDKAESYQNANGYTVDAWFVSPNVYSLMKNVSFNNTRFDNINPNDTAILGYAQDPVKVMTFNGKPVVMDKNMYSGGENILAVSLDPKNLVTAELQGPVVETFNQVQPTFDGDSWRVKQYSTTILKNPLSAVLLQNVILPTPANF